MTPLDWLMPALADAPVGDRPLFDVHLHDVDEMADWRAAEHADERERSARSAVARCEALPADEPLEPDDSAAEEMLSRIAYVYPHLASASVRASMAASEFKGGYDFMQSPEESPHRPRDDDFQVPPSKYAASVRDDAAHRGVITHRILQHLDFLEAANAAGVALELQRMVRDGVVSAEALEMVDRDSIEWFASTPLAELIRGAGDSYRREFPYIATEPLLYFDHSVDALPGDHVLVRGIVDGILPVADGIELVDFKTDAVGADQVEERSMRYRPQMELYTRAMARIWRRPVRACWLVFLAPRKLIRWQDVTAEPDR
jgi:ATP-dependent helicase/nuclease subunit A